MTWEFQAKSLAGEVPCQDLVVPPSLVLQDNPVSFRSLPLVLELISVDLCSFWAIILDYKCSPQRTAKIYEGHRPHLLQMFSFLKFCFKLSTLAFWSMNWLFSITDAAGFVSKWVRKKCWMAWNLCSNGHMFYHACSKQKVKDPNTQNLMVAFFLL